MPTRKLVFKIDPAATAKLKRLLDPVRMRRSRERLIRRTALEAAALWLVSKKN